MSIDPVDAALRSLMPMDPTEALRRMLALLQDEPNLRAIDDDYSCPAATLKWLGQLHAVVSAMKRSGDEISLNLATQQLLKTKGQLGSAEIRAVLYRSLAAAELAAPASEQGAFIAAGNELDAYAAISKLIASATKDLLIVDPYMDGKALSDFMPSAEEGVTLRIMVDEAAMKLTLAPALEKWKLQFGVSRPLEVRLASPRSLHDRLVVVDGIEVWSLTQSLKDFASRSHGSVLKAGTETASLKVNAYDRMWQEARSI